MRVFAFSSCKQPFKITSTWSIYGVPEVFDLEDPENPETHPSKAGSKNFVTSLGYHFIVHARLDVRLLAFRGSAGEQVGRWGGF